MEWFIPFLFVAIACGGIRLRMKLPEQPPTQAKEAVS
jgi:hypothetical protein